MAIGILFFLGGMRMPWKMREYPWFVGPGFVPCILSTLLFLLGLILFMRTLLRKRRAGVREPGKLPAASAKPATVEPGRASARVTDQRKTSGSGRLGDPGFRLLLAMGLCALYVFLLLGRIPYWLATSLFVAGFILAFKGGGLVRSAIIGVATALAVIFVFYKVFTVFLP